MKAERERTLAGIAVGATILVWSGVMALVFYVPRLTALWAELDRLSASQRMLAALSGPAETYFFALAPILLAATVAAVWWRLHCSECLRRNTTANRSSPANV